MVPVEGDRREKDSNRNGMKTTEEEGESKQGELPSQVCTLAQCVALPGRFLPLSAVVKEKET